MDQQYYFYGRPIVAPVTFSSMKKFYDNRRLDLKRSVATTPHVRFTWSFRVVPGDCTEMFSIMMSGEFEEFDFTVPQMLSPERNHSALIGSIIDHVPAGSTTIPVSAGLILPSTFIRFSNHQKIYMVKTRKDPLGSTMSIFPELQVSLSSANTFNYGNNVVARVMYAPDTVRGITFSDGVLSDPGTISLEEN
jgi:hypothetical protein